MHAASPEGDLLCGRTGVRHGWKSRAALRSTSLELCPRSLLATRQMLQSFLHPGTRCPFRFWRALVPELTFQQPWSPLPS